MDSRTSIRIAGILVTALVLGLLRNVIFPGGISFQSNSANRNPASSDTLSLEISVETAHRFFQDSVQFIDARTHREFQKEHLPGAINIPASASFEEKSKLTSQLTPERMYVVYCNNPECPLSHQLYEYLQFADFTNTHIMYEGIDGWNASDLPTVSEGVDANQ